MITLFHGSYISVQAPLVKLGRKKVDFGQGFYLTNLRKQAESWAKTIAERKGRNTQPANIVFLFGKRALLSEGLGYQTLYYAAHLVACFCNSFKYFFVCAVLLIVFSEYVAYHAHAKYSHAAV